METQPSQCRWLNIYKRTTGASRSLRSIKVLHWIFSGCTVLRVTHSTMLVAKVLLLLFGLLTVHGGDPTQDPVSPVDCYEGKGESYKGVVSKTEEGEDCLHWNDTLVQQHGEHSTDLFLDSNNCRNPDGDKMPWCYIKKQEKLDWNYCDVKKCSPEFSECGKPVPGKIVRGVKSLPGVIPWQASVQVRSKGTSGGFSHICGGTLISSCWVLTAGHCIKSYYEYQVMLGGVNMNKTEGTEQTIPVIETIRHENYKNIYPTILTADNVETTIGISQNDIALLKLSVMDGHHCAKETPYVRTACLTDQTFPAGKDCVISGWGKTENGTASSRLLKARVPLISDEQCKARQVYGDALDSSMLCAGYLEGGVDSCKGDSGGPLVCEENGTHKLTGVVSWGYGCARVTKPGVYTDVHEFLGWIHNKTTGQ